MTLSSAQAATLWSTDFLQPPYALNETVVGKQGWVLVQSDSGNLTDASLVSYAGATGGTALEIISSAPPTQRRTSIYNTFEKVTGPKVEVQLSVAYNWTGSSSSAASFAFNQLETYSPVIVSFVATRGLSISGTYGGRTDEIFLSVDEMAQDSFYEFRFVFDFEQRVFSMAVDGKDASGQDYHLLLTDISFRHNTPNLADGIDGVKFMNNRGDYLRFYTDSISVKSIPEGSSAMMLGLGSIAVVAGCFMRKSPLRKR